MVDPKGALQNLETPGRQPERREPEGGQEERGRLDEEFARKIARKQSNRLRARRHKGEELWFGLGMFGLIGWSVAVPTLIGLAIGIMIDTRRPGGVSWTLILFVGGLLLGCWNTWFWISREQRAIEKREKEDG